MAGKRKPPRAGNVGKILPQIPIATGLAMLDQLFPESKAYKRTSDTVRMCCPIHADNTPSFDCNFLTGRCGCYGCGYVTYNFLDFLKRAKGWSHKQSLDSLRSYVNFRQLTDVAIKDLTAKGVWQDAMQFVCACFNLHAQRLLSRPTNNPLYSPALYEAVRPTLVWLFETRKRDPGLVSVMPYGIVPNGVIFEELLKELLDAELVRREARNLEYPDKEWREAVAKQALEIYGGIDSAYVHSVAYFMANAYDQYYRIKLRKASDDKSIIVLGGQTPDEPLGFFGLCTPRNITRGVSDGQAVQTYVVEGENDALSLMEGIEREGTAGIRVIASGGTANEMDALKECCDIQEARLIADEPVRGKGNEFIVNRAATAKALQLSIFVGWGTITEEHIEVKDPDDLVQCVGYKKAAELLFDDHAYVTTPQWAYSQVHQTAQQREQDPAGPDTLRATLVAVERYGQCVRHPAELTQFVEQVAAYTNIPQGEIRTAIASGKNDERAFLLTLDAQFRREFCPMYVTGSARPALVAHHRESRRTVEIVLSDAEAIGISIAQSNGSVYEWIRDKVGLPSFLNAEDPDAPNVTPEKTLTPVLQQYLKLAMQLVVKDVPTYNKCVEYGAGMHLLPDPVSGEPAVYWNVNDRVFKAFKDPIHPKFTAIQELPGPADGTHLFRTSPQPWSTEIQTQADIEEGNSITLEQCHEAVKKCVDIVSRGWCFQHQAEHSQYVGWLIGAMPLLSFWPRKILLHVGGQTHSGKSSLLALFGAGGNPLLKLTEFVARLDNFSEAALIQQLANTPVMAVIDEFENHLDNQRQSMTVEAVTRLMRNVHSPDGVAVVRGSAGGKPVHFRLQAAFLTAGIEPFRKLQDENRRLTIEMRFSEGHGDSAKRVFQKYTPEDLRMIRRILTNGLPKYYDLFRQHYDQVAHEIETTSLASYNVPPRFVTNLLPVLALMSMFGENWAKLFRDMCEAQKEKIQSGVAETPSAMLEARLFRAANIQTVMRTDDSYTRKVTSRVTDLLRNQTTVDVLNDAHCGIYVDYTRQIAIIDWVNAQGRNGILENWSDYRNVSPRNLKHILDQHPRAIHSQDYVRLGVPDFVRSTGSTYNPTAVSVMDISELILEVRAAADAVRESHIQSTARPSTTTERKAVSHDTGNTVVAIVPSSDDTDDTDNNI